MIDKKIYEEENFYITQETLKNFSIFLAYEKFKLINLPKYDLNNKNKLTFKTNEQEAFINFIFDEEINKFFIEEKFEEMPISARVELDKGKLINSLKEITFYSIGETELRSKFKEELTELHSKISIQILNANIIDTDKVFSGTGFFVDTETESYFNVFQELKLYFKPEDVETKLTFCTGMIYKKMQFERLKESIAIDFYFDEPLPTMRFQNLSLMADCISSNIETEKKMVSDAIYWTPKNNDPNFKLIKDFKENKLSKFLMHYDFNMDNNVNPNKNTFNGLIL